MRMIPFVNLAAHEVTFSIGDKNYTISPGGEINLPEATRSGAQGVHRLFKSWRRNCPRLGSYAKRVTSSLDRPTDRGPMYAGST